MYKLLFITQRINELDDDLAFVIQWIDEFKKQNADVSVICLEKGQFDGHFPVYSLGKESGASKWQMLKKYYGYIRTFEYDRVFVHMNPEYITLGCLYWLLKKRPVYLWYTHYKTHIHLLLSNIFCKRLFAATEQSMPMLRDDKKRVILGHGVDIGFWEDGVGVLEDAFADEIKMSHNLLAVHRLCRSKRIEIGIKALKYLPEDYTLTIYGREIEMDYVKEIYDLVEKENLQSRVKFMGPVEMKRLKNIYPKHKMMINMAYETIDKTMLEAMLFGLYPITTQRNVDAIGIPRGIEESVGLIRSVFDESVENMARKAAEFILLVDSGKIDQGDIVNIEGIPVPSPQELKNIVKERHSLKGLVEKMNRYIIPGL